MSGSISGDWPVTTGTLTLRTRYAVLWSWSEELEGILAGLAEVES
jgi:hypothetical protein